MFVDTKAGTINIEKVVNMDTACSYHIAEVHEGK